MKWFRDITIQRKLMLITMLTSIVALFLASATFVTYEWNMFRGSITNQFATLAQIIGSNSTAALAFQDHKSAEEILSALSVENHVIRACIYGKDGKVFATYLRPDARKQSNFPAPKGSSHSFEPDHLSLFSTVQLDGEFLGTVYLESDLQQLYSRFRLYGFIVAAVMIASTLVAFLLSSKLQRLISDPILNLAKMARNVSMNKNYSVRAEKKSGDELGLLVEDFNEMLTQIQVRDSALQEQTAELEAANKELEAFSYSVSHDLRAPLRKIDGFGQALLEDYGDKLDETGKDYLHRTRRASQHLAELIDDMLNLSQVTRTEMVRETVDLGTMAKSIATDLHQTQPERKVTFEITEGLIVNGDAHLLWILLENLLGNAWKFTGKHEQARIVFGSITQNGQPVYYVRDDGAGFDMTYAHKLFGPFQRLHETKEFEGTGIGLATVQRIIHRHGGTVWAESAIEKGTTFYFTL